ncbi:MAG: heterodisulfide reductase-related iron-sulfur binding cluster [Filifactoraceae bacterium]
MVNKKALLIDINQRLTFSNFMARTQSSSQVFLPGCSLNSFGEEIVLGSLELLKKAIPNIKLSSYCCGKPSTHINQGRDFEGRFDKLYSSLESKGVSKIVTGCPNCYKLLSSKLQGIEVVSIWKVLDEVIKLGDINLEGQRFIVHDPCSTKDLEEEHSHIRSILTKINVDVVEFEYSKKRTMCCGQKNMMMVLDRNKAMKILQNRVVQSGDYKIVSYCAACVKAFRSVDKEAVHLLELILGVSGVYSLENRLRVARSLK